MVLSCQDGQFLGIMLDFMGVLPLKNGGGLFTDSFLGLLVHGKGGLEEVFVIGLMTQRYLS